MRKSQSMKRFLPLLLVLTLVFTMLPTTALAAENDIAGHWAEGTMQQWIDLELLSGDGNGIYRPNASITRAEFFTFINRMMGYTEKSGDISQYTDVSPGRWYYDQVAIALSAGYTTGKSATTMAPETNITREEAMTIVARIAEVDELSETSILSQVNDGDRVSVWAKGYVAAVISQGLIAGSNGNVTPLSNITRAETVTLLDRVRTDTRTFAFAGTYGPADGTQEVNTVSIAADGVTLRNMAISGNLTIDATVGNGEATLNSVDVAGKFNVLGGGLNSIYLNNCNITELIIGKDSVRVVMADGSVITTLRAEGGNDSIELGEGVKIGTLTIADDGAAVKIAAGASITTLNLNGAAAVTGEGTITTANINVNGCTIEPKPATTNVANNVTATVSGQTVTGSETASDDSGPSNPSGGKSATVTGVTVTCADTVALGATLTLTATVAGSNGPSQSVTWAVTEDTGEADVSGNKLTAKKKGTVSVVATSNADDTKKSEPYMITITDQVISVEAGKIYRLTNAENNNVQYVTADKTVSSDIEDAAPVTFGGTITLTSETVIWIPAAATAYSGSVMTFTHDETSFLPPASYEASQTKTPASGTITLDGVDNNDLWGIGFSFTDEQLGDVGDSSFKMARVITAAASLAADEVIPVKLKTIAVNEADSEWEVFGSGALLTQGNMATGLYLWHCTAGVPGISPDYIEGKSIAYVGTNTHTRYYVFETHVGDFQFIKVDVTAVGSGAVLTAFNAATTAGALDALFNTHKDALGIDLTGYNALDVPQQEAIREAVLAGKPFASVTEIQTAFNNAVTMVQDNAAITAAKDLIEGTTYTADQADVTDVASAKAKVEAIIGALALDGVTAVVVGGDFEAAEAETAALGNGVLGSYKFTVTLSKGLGAPQTTGTLTLTISPTPFDPANLLKNDDVLAAEGITIAVSDVTATAATITLSASETLENGSLAGNATLKAEAVPLFHGFFDNTTGAVANKYTPNDDTRYTAIGFKTSDILKYIQLSEGDEFWIVQKNPALKLYSDNGLDDLYVSGTTKEKQYIYTNDDFGNANLYILLGDKTEYGGAITIEICENSGSNTVGDVLYTITITNSVAIKKMPIQEANEFKADHAAILDKDTSTLTLADKTILEAAEAVVLLLSAGAKDLLEDQLERLKALREQMDELADKLLSTNDVLAAEGITIAVSEVTATSLTIALSGGLEKGDVPDDLADDAFAMFPGFFDELGAVANSYGTNKDDKYTAIRFKISDILKCVGLSEGEKFWIVQTNPALVLYWDNGLEIGIIDEKIKTKSYPYSETGFEEDPYLCVLLGDSEEYGGNITIKIYSDNNNNVGTLLYTITITNDVAIGATP